MSATRHASLRRSGVYVFVAGLVATAVLSIVLAPVAAMADGPAPIDPTSNILGIFANAPLAAALMWIFNRVLDRDKEREAAMLQREREREAASAKRDELFAARDERISDALKELGSAVHDLSVNCQRGRNDTVQMVSARGTS